VPARRRGWWVAGERERFRYGEMGVPRKARQNPSFAPGNPDDDEGFRSTLWLCTAI